MKNPVVLIVDDAGACRATLEIALQALTAEVRSTASAEEALTIINRCEISAVITDLHLPAMDGFELIQRIRALPRWSRLPILVTSGDSDPRTPARVMGAGANAFFPKPYSPAAVRQKLEQLMDADDSHDAAEPDHTEPALDADDAHAP